MSSKMSGDRQLQMGVPLLSFVEVSPVPRRATAVNYNAEVSIFHRG
jgi:hypothetical protein